VADQNNVVRRLAFWFAVLFVFLRFSMLHEYVTYLTGSNTYILYIVGLPAILGILAGGGIRRGLRHRVAFFWIAFVVWMALTIPSSHWRGGSTRLLYTYLKTEILMFFLIAGLALTWKECTTVMYAIAAAGVVNVLIGRATLGEIGERFALEITGGNIANPNDFAAHLILVAPFLLSIILDRTKLFIWRLTALAAVAAALYLILGTASRGALVALGAMSVFVILKGTARWRMAGVVLVPLCLLVLLPALPQRISQRLFTFSSSSGADEEARMAQETRMYLLTQSLRFTLEHPVFGVGPGQFSNYEGATSRSQGEFGSWRQTHNTFTQVSSECGIPALLFYVAALITAYRLLSRAHRQAKEHPQSPEMATATFCVLLSMVGFSTAAFFLSMAYHFYFPALTGLAVAMASASMEPDPNSVTASLPGPPAGGGIAPFRPAATAATPRPWRQAGKTSPPL
jgi:O-antigen ligase